MVRSPLLNVPAKVLQRFAVRLRCGSSNQNTDIVDEGGGEVAFLFDQLGYVGIVRDKELAIWATPVGFLWLCRR